MATSTQTLLFRWLRSYRMLAGVVLACGAGPIATTVAETPERTPLPPGQVWQCVRDGHRTFSDAPCGAGATIRQLNDVNIMDPAPARGPVYATPRVAYVPSAASYRDDQPSMDGADAMTSADPVYGIPGVGIVTAGQRGRRALQSPRPSRPLHRDAAAARAHAGHAAGR